MKYSLKNQYKHLLKEEVSQSLVDDEKHIVRIEFDGDKPSIARYYNIADAPERTTSKEKFMVYKKEFVDLGTISSINVGTNKIFSSKSSLTKSSIKKTAPSGQVKKIFVKSFIDFVEDKIINGLMNNESDEKFKIIDKIDSYDAEEFIQTVFTEIPSFEYIINNVNDLSNLTSFNSAFDQNYNFASEKDELFIDFIKKQNDLANNSFSYTMEDFISYNHRKNLPDGDDFRKYKADVNNSMTITYSDFFSDTVKLKEMFKKAKEVTKEYINFSISNVNSELTSDDFEVNNFNISNIAKAIAYEYCGNKTPTTFISDLRTSNITKDDFRKECSNINDAINHLNKCSEKFRYYKGKGGGQGSVKGDGEFHAHMFLKTTNACLDIEPDAIIKTSGGIVKCSVKAFSSRTATAQTGTTLPANISASYFRFKNAFVKNSFSGELNGQNIAGHRENNKYYFNKKILNDLVFIDISDEGKYSINNTKRKNALKLYKDFKKSIAAEHNADGIISFFTDPQFNNNKLFAYTSVEECGDHLTFNGMPSNKRIGFAIRPVESDYSKRLRTDKLILMLLTDDSRYSGSNNNQTLKNQIDAVNSNSNKVRIFESNSRNLKNILLEGGKAGHMMHPYENLHMKISDMKRMIEDFQNDFEISEKVDGANLFFTITDQGKVMFSRNKSDMSYQETLDKFKPPHKAHILFNEGATSIFNAIQRSLSMEEVRQIFGQHPEGGKTYINFEIMHPKKSNQIRYDMKYIVFHAIVDYDINGDKVLSSPDDTRLLNLIEKLQPHFNTYDNDFNLGSNFKIKLNNLSSEDIDELHRQLENITSALGISDDMTIADAVKSEIKTLLDRENILNRLSEEKIEMIYDFITNESSVVKGTQIKKGLDKEIKDALVDLGLTSKTKAYNIVKKVISDFKPLFILLGIKLLHNVQSRYMSSKASKKNVSELRRLLVAAIEDYNEIISRENLSEKEEQIVNSLKDHIEDVNYYGVDYVVSSPVEGGVFIGYDGNTYKVTGGFAPLNQILGTAMRNEDYLPRFKQEYKLQERGS